MAAESLVFACAAESSRDMAHAVALAESLRRFGGELAAEPFWVLAPPAVMAETQLQLADLARAGADVLVLREPPSEDQLPFSTKSLGAAMAEGLAARSQAQLLAWLDAGSLVVNEPRPLLLPPSAVFGYRPVDHTLIGSPYTAAVDAFWQEIYDRCGTPADRLFPMPTTVDARVLRPYFNAGLMVVRPERGIFGRWQENLKRLQADIAFAPFLSESLYRVFFHQAVLAATVLSAVEPAAMALLPATVSYPLHLHAQQARASRAESLEQLTTLRHEGVFDEPDWRVRLEVPVGEELASWLAGRFGPAQDAADKGT